MTAKRARIFIGSSSERLEHAQQVASALRAANFEAFAWWEDGVFPASEYTLDRLIQLAENCDGAVMLFFGDEEAWYRTPPKVRRAGAKPVLVVRDNVVLEFGLFVGLCSRQDVVIVSDKVTHQPSDIFGLTTIHVGRRITRTMDISTAASQVVKHFVEREDVRSFHPDAEVVLHTNWKMEIHEVRYGGEESWRSCDLYSSDMGSDAWARVEGNPEYAARTLLREGGQVIGEMAGDYDVSTVVSLGPGAGIVDHEVLAHLPAIQWREYVPVDVSRRLMLQSASLAASNAKVTCTRGILVDFEQDLGFVGDIIRRKTKGPRLLMMNGGTISNLRKSETSLVNNIASIMEVGDLFVFDLFCFTTDYAFKNDPLADLSKVPECVRYFFSCGVLRLNRRQLITQKEAESRLEAVPFRAIRPKDVKGVSIQDRESQSVVVDIKRFRYNYIKSLIEKAGFEIVEKRQFEAGVLRRHFLLARRVAAS